jgi:NitT/TauT family transport system permease protein
MNRPNVPEAIRNRLLVLAMVALGLLVWELAADRKMVNTFYTSKPTVIFSDFYQFARSGELFTHLAVTLREAFSGLVFGTLAGVVCGVALGRIAWLGNLFEPIITALYGIPKLALAPIFILWFGLGLESKIFLSALLVFYLVFFSTFAGIRSIDANLVAAIRLMGASRLQLVTRVTLPSCVPWILTGVRGGIGASLLGAIVGEYMGASAGLGWMIQYATTTYQIERVMACIVVLLLIGLVLNKGLNACERRLLRWRPGHG